MSLTPELAVEVVAACQAGAEEASGALGRALDGTLKLAPGEATTASEAQLAGPGLLVVLKVGSEAAVFVVPESLGVLPSWYGAPDATGTSKLATLAQELGMLLLPESCMPDDFSALRVADIPAALTRGQIDAAAAAVPLKISATATTGDAWLLWPIANPAQLADAPAAAAPPVAATPAARPAATPPSASTKRPALAIHTGDIEQALPQMPTYTRSLLKIRVPIVVTLAKSHQPLSRIIELAPGSIIPFTKSCDDTLTLEVNNREVAVGEAVKVGDKFGLRITSMTLPPERFVPLKGRQA